MTLRVGGTAPSGGIAAYAGEFHSDELDVTWRIVMKDSVIEVGMLGSWSFRPQPIFRDAFALPEAVVLRFTRDKRGRIDGLLADMPRTRGIRFGKVSPGRAFPRPAPSRAIARPELR